MASSSFDADQPARGAGLPVPGRRDRHRAHNLGAAVTIRRQGTLVYLLALGVLLAGLGRLVSISQVGLPAPAPVWLGYLIPELLLPVVIAVAHAATNRHASRGAAAA